jgi:hypothetical protein
MMITRDRTDSNRKSAKMQFVLTGFTQELAFRVFAFERVGDDRVRTQCTVRADIVLSRRYGIQLQDLPSLCRGLLERSFEGGEMHPLTYSEEEMCGFAKGRAADREAAAAKRKPPRRPPSVNVGTAWRAPSPR